MRVYIRTCDFVLLNLPPLAHVTKTCEDDTKSLISLTKVHAVCVCGGGGISMCACMCMYLDTYFTLVY